MGGGTVPQANQGNMNAALIKVRNAAKMLEEALPLIPMGNDLHTEILNTVKGLAKHLKKGDENPQLEQQSMIQQIRQQAQGAPMAALARMFGGGGGGEGQPPAT